MKKFLIVWGLTCMTTLGFTQKFSIKGQVLDSMALPLPSATVMLLNLADSSLVNFAASDSQGIFEMRNVNRGDYELKVTFVGFAPFSKKITTPINSSALDLEQVRLQPIAKQLDEIIIQGEKAPVTVKRDTIEFNAGSFKVKANANVEDLLKRMPGMEVESDGTVKAQGEQVQRVTVDGREFFGRDPKLATRNLPADAIDKVQVFDKKSDQSLFTGIEDGQREKTINLELKEEKRNGAFGNIMGGAGTEDRFQAKASVNRFGKGRQLSFLGMGNNINEQGFSMDEFMNFTGGSQQLMGGGGGMVRMEINSDNQNGVPLNFGGRQNGIMTNYAGGINFNKDLTKRTQLTSSYFYNRLDQNVRQQTQRVNYLPNDSSYNYAENVAQLNANDNHRVNLTIDHKIDSANSIKTTNSLTYSDSELNSQTNSRTTTLNEVLQNTSNRTNYNAQTRANLNSSLLYRHRFAKKGRTFSTNLTLGFTQTESNGNQQSSNEYFTTLQEKQEIVQTNSQNTDYQSYGITVSYTEPLGGRKYLEGNYNLRTNRNQVNRLVFDEMNGSQILNTQLTNKYNSVYVYNRPGINFRLNRQKYNFTVGASWQNTRLQGDLISRNQKIDRTFENLLPVARFNYDFSNFKHVRMDYETSMQEPSIQQLQPVVDNGDPLNIYVGNPELRPAYQQRLSTNFTTYDPARFINLFAFATVTHTGNTITNSQTVDKNLVRTTKPVNVKNNIDINTNLSFGFPLKMLNSRFNIGPMATYARGINLLNEQESKTSQQTMGGMIRYNYTFKEIVTVDLGASLSHQETKYEFNAQNNQVYFNKTYSVETNLYFLKNYQFNSGFEYLIYNSETSNYSQTIPLLDLSVSRFMLKNKAGELKFGVNNLLDKNLSVSQTATANYLQQQVSNNLGRYFMLSFTYSLNKQLNPMGAMRRPGVRMINSH
ncbi:MAG: outer membrane beta-barrel protein [Flavobacteriales bacterium]